MLGNHRRILLLVALAVAGAFVKRRIRSPLLIGVHDLSEHAGFILVTWLGGGMVSFLVVTRFSVLLRRARSLADTRDADLAQGGRLERTTA